MRTKKFISSTLCILLSLSVFSTTTYALDDNGNSGSGSQGGSSGGQFSWIEPQAGYRFAIVDNNLKQVSNTVDILYSDPSKYSFKNNRYTNSRANSLSTDTTNIGVYLWTDLKNDGQIDAFPKYAVEYSGNTAIANGEKIKEYMLAGREVMSEITIPPVYKPPVVNNSNSVVNNN